MTQRRDFWLLFGVLFGLAVIYTVIQMIYQMDIRSILAGKKELLAALDQISGCKVLLLDSCYAGMLIPVLESRGKEAEKYAVLTAAGAREEAYNGKAAQGSYGWFTSAVLLGCGIQELTGERLPRVPADQNGDGAVSLREIWRFASDYLAGLSARQHPQLFLPEEDLILWVR